MDYRRTAYSRIVLSLVSATREGPVSQWVDRIGQVVRDYLATGVSCPSDDSFDWSGSPANVAHHVADDMVRCTTSAGHDFLEFVESRP
jgi:hypothetical protein